MARGEACGPGRCEGGGHALVDAEQSEASLLLMAWWGGSNGAPRDVTSRRDGGDSGWVRI